ncbi:unnamed protein product [Rodentolepis nana]|uniref:Guanylate cyclase n=1 Tax=Rodentolepis nana TaxID=102285 RepID=A0A0R3TX12_RODNA|nr:unnamed protein product [Rodentolepis nana]
MVRDIFKNFLEAYAVERLKEVQVLGDFYELSMEKSLQQLEYPNSSAILYAVFGNLEANSSSLDAHNLTQFPLFYAQETSNKLTCLQSLSSDTAALCYAIPFSIGFSTSFRAKIFNMTSIKLTNGQTILRPLLPSVETFIFDPTNHLSYPLVRTISLILKKRYTSGGKLNPDVCKATTELKRFLEWVVTSEIARDILNNASCVLIGDKYGVLKSYLTSMECSRDESLITVDLYTHKFEAKEDSGTTNNDDDDDGDDGDLDNITIFTVAANCFGILLLVIGVMVMRRFLSQWAEIRGDVWKITEVDLVPPEAEGLESFSVLIPQTSSRQSFTQFECRASCQRSSLFVPGFNTVDSKSICGIYKSTSVILNPTHIPLSRIFDYNTRKTLIELRKVSHSRVLRFHGLANIVDRTDTQLAEDEEMRDFRFAAGDNFSERLNFSFENNDINTYYLVTEQCTGENIFYFMHCASMGFPYEAKVLVIIQLIDAIDYLHDHGIVHGKLNSQCCQFDHNFNIKVSDWECVEILEKYGRLHNSDIYLPSKMIDFLQKVNALRPASDRKCRTMNCINMNAVMRLRWRPPECLCFELPLVKELFSYPEEPIQATDEQFERIEELGEEDTQKRSYEINLSHFQDPAVDIYSLGVIVNEVWARAIPYSEKDPEYEGEIKLLEAVAQGEISLEIPTNVPEVVASLDEEEKRMNAVKEALMREFLPKPLADKTLEAISNGSDEMEALESAMKPNRYLQIVVALNRLNRLVTNIIEERKILRISSFGTIVMMTSDPQGGDNDSVRQAISVTDCALDLQNCLRCFGKIPRTDVNPEFAIALDTGAVAMGVMPGNVPS